MKKQSALRIVSPRASRCCTWPTVIVQSREGGLVKANCTRCGAPWNLSNYEFLYMVRCAVDCPRCADRMHKVIFDRNYCFKCPSCRRIVRLADLVPWWYEVEPNQSRIELNRRL